MLKELRLALFLIAAMTVLTGIAYPLVVTGIAQMLFPWRANGSIVLDEAGQPIGSALIAQRFDRPDYFHPRPSAVDYDAQGSGASNAAPSSKRLIAAITARTEAERATSSERKIPVEMVTASASGLDPHISADAAYAQAPRVARLRNMAEGDIWKLIGDHVEDRSLGFIGELRVNVLELNRALDALPRQGEAVR
ncbi:MULTISPECIES: potassium-transporting ATPase subunit KdpC [Rhodomicrobium]|uniref:potassium-transporting ATPase subunit KdpC n=1 Tax=Rhodomicrobium TaxID=1068 RepID=UPI000B4B339E|nr:MULTISPECIES: potassium-transporting ATPase subunit KdpC [Rhodomicrobium]